MKARIASDKRINVKLQKVSDAATAVRIRIGTIGDDAISHSILDKLKKGL